jgi:hypothetical protein
MGGRLSARAERRLPVGRAAASERPNNGPSFATMVKSAVQTRREPEPLPLALLRFEK